jgi:hypothetical protein
MVAHALSRARLSASRQAHRCIDLVGLDADFRNRSACDGARHLRFRTRGPQGHYATLRHASPWRWLPRAGWRPLRRRSTRALVFAESSSAKRRQDADLRQSFGRKPRQNLAVLPPCRGVAAMSCNLKPAGLTEEARATFIPLAVTRPRQPLGWPLIPDVTGASGWRKPFAGVVRGPFANLREVLKEPCHLA